MGNLFETLKIAKPMISMRQNMEERTNVVFAGLHIRQRHSRCQQTLPKMAPGHNQQKTGQALLTLCAGKWNQQHTGNRQALQARAEP